MHAAVTVAAAVAVVVVVAFAAAVASTSLRSHSFMLLHSNDARRTHSQSTKSTSLLAGCASASTVHCALYNTQCNKLLSNQFCNLLSFSIRSIETSLATVSLHRHQFSRLISVSRNNVRLYCCVFYILQMRCDVMLLNRMNFFSSAWNEQPIMLSDLQRKTEHLHRNEWFISKLIRISYSNCRVFDDFLMTLISKAMNLYDLTSSICSFSLQFRAKVPFSCPFVTILFFSVGFMLSLWTDLAMLN